MLIVVGLGNPGDKYAHTRHNAGFDVVTILSTKMNIPLTKNRFNALIGEGFFEGQKVVLVQPQTYMNLSGESVVQIENWYKPEPGEMIVVYDDVDLPAGSLRIRASGSAGTHNGMRSIVEKIGRTNFPRVRVGIGAPPPGWDMADFVIGHYPTAEARKVAFDSFMLASEAVILMLKEGVEAAMRTYNHKNG